VRGDRHVAVIDQTIAVIVDRIAGEIGFPGNSRSAQFDLMTALAHAGAKGLACAYATRDGMWHVAFVDFAVAIAIETVAVVIWTRRSSGMAAIGGDALHAGALSRPRAHAGATARSLRNVAFVDAPVAVVVNAIAARVIGCGRARNT
jgi:hypothetical protein